MRCHPEPALTAAWWTKACEGSSWCGDGVGRTRARRGAVTESDARGGDTCPLITAVNTEEVSAAGPASCDTLGECDMRMTTAADQRKIIIGDLATYCPEDLVENTEFCDEMIAFLDTRGRDEAHLVDWLAGYEVRLSLASRCSCRVVQKLLEVLGAASRDQLVAQLLPHTLELLESLHGNHVLTKIIEVIPRPGLDAFITRLELHGARAVAKHRLGCRVVERLVEHGTEQQMCRLLDEWVQLAEELSRHQYGNFVIQSVLEHGAPPRRQGIVQQLLPSLPQLATHRTASHVVQKALNHISLEGQRAMAMALLQASPPSSLPEVAASRYGSFVVEELCCAVQGDAGREALRQLAGALPGALEASPHFARVAVRLGLAEERPSHAPEAVAHH